MFVIERLDRPRRAPSRLRPGGAAPAQPGAGDRDAVSQPARSGLRQRRLRGGAGPRGGPRRLGGVRGAPGRGPRVAVAIAASVWRTTSSSTPVSRASARRSPSRPEGRIDVVIGTLSAGQGHETSFAQLIAEWFDVGVDRVQIIAGDTDVAPRRRRLALGPVDAPGRGGDGQGVGPDRRAGPASRGVAARSGRGRRRARERPLRGEGHRPRRGDCSRSRPPLSGRTCPTACGGPLAGASDETMSVPSYPYGCAVCEVEVDPETGAVEIVRYTTVDDVGRAVNPLILHGQTHGGIAAGVGQALWELCHYDAVTGQMTSATFMDYVLPRADDFPFFATEISEVPSTTNPLGLRGGGEGGTTPALGAVINAIVDALGELGVEHVEMPATPERVWNAIHAARQPHPGSPSSADPPRRGEGQRER